MASAWTASPWVEQHRDGVSFALQVFPIDTPVDPQALDTALASNAELASATPRPAAAACKVMWEKE